MDNTQYKASIQFPALLELLGIDANKIITNITPRLYPNIFRLSKGEIANTDLTISQNAFSQKDVCLLITHNGIEGIIFNIMARSALKDANIQEELLTITARHEKGVLFLHEMAISSLNKDGSIEIDKLNKDELSIEQIYEAVSEFNKRNPNSSNDIYKRTVSPTNGLDAPVPIKAPQIP